MSALEELAIFKLVDGPAPEGVAYSAVPIIRRPVVNAAKEVVGERIELQNVRFVGSSIEDVQAKAAAAYEAELAKQLQRDRSMREAAEKRAKARLASWKVPDAL